MSRRKVGPTWKLIIAYIILIILALYLVVGCGVRKTESSKESTKIESENKDTSKGEVKKESGQSEGQSSKDLNAIINESQTKRITELFNENGSLKSRVTELENTRMEDNSSKETNSFKTTYTRIDSVFNVTNYKKLVITERKKQKSTDADKSISTNFGGPGYLIIALIIVVAAVFLYFYLNKRR